MKPRDTRMSTVQRLPQGEYVQKTKNELFSSDQPQSTSAAEVAVSHSRTVTFTIATNKSPETIKVEFDVAGAERRAKLAKLNERLDRDRSR